MILTVRLLGVEVLHIELSDSPVDEDDMRHLSGGDTGSARVEAGVTDLYLGFTNGRGDG